MDNKSGKRDIRLKRFVRASQLVGLASGVAAAGLLAQRYRRPRDVRWFDHAHTLPHSMSSSFRVIDGIRIHYQEKHTTSKESKEISNKETIILLHGFCSSNYTWKDCYNSFVAAGYRVIAPDLKGFGFSEKPSDSKYSALDQVDLVVGLMESLKIDNATFVGNSYGGAISLACAIKYPERVNRLVLLNAAHTDGAIPNFFRRTARAAELYGPTLFGSKTLIKLVMNNMYHNKSLITEERYEAYHRPVRSAACQTAAFNTLRQWNLGWMRDKLKFIKHPTLVIWGEQDWLIPVSLGAKLHLQIDSSEFVVIPECGHLPQEERPEDTCSFIVDFCKRSQKLHHKRLIS
ncbi:MAG: alpha/beta hydrolase [Blastocatellia bacterium]|nr:alpha/beta hydrolase [Blastocatellia bacterium]